MNKYALKFNQYVNKKILLNDILPLISTGTVDMVNNKIIEYLGIDESTLNNPIISIEIFDQKKNMKSYMTSTSIEGNDANKIKLRSLGINDYSSSYEEIYRLWQQILKTEDLLNELNLLSDFSLEKVKEILFKYQIIVSESLLIIFVDLLNQIYLDNLTENISGYNPIIRKTCYDSNNQPVLKIEMGKQSNVYSTLTEFTGEIYESLNFENNQEAKDYQIKNHIKEDLLEDVVSVLHFNCESTLSCWYNDLTILKYKVGCIYIDYGERLFVQNKQNNTSITPEEIDLIIQEFRYREINNDFITYVIRELEEFKKSLVNGDSKQVPVESIKEVILKRKQSLDIAKEILDTPSYGDGKTIYVGIKVISDNPILFTKDPAMIKN